MQRKVRPWFQRTRLRASILGLGLAAVNLLEVGCSLNPTITQSEIRQPAVVSSSSTGTEPIRVTDSVDKVVALASHNATATDNDSSTLILAARADNSQSETDSVRLIHEQSAELSSDRESTDARALGNVMTLEELESLALANNPAIQELAATTQKAAGYRTQVLVKPNPVVGYQGQQLADRGTDQHLAFMEREFVTGGKLQLNHRVLNAALCAQLQELEAQRWRVTTDIRVRFYQALAIRKQLELITEFSGVAEKGLRLAELRKAAAEGSQVDVLQARIQRSEVTLSKRQANAKLSAIWREIAALAGVPDLPYATLAGTLPTETKTLDWNELGGTLVASSPEYSAAQARISRAHAALERQLVQPIPNVAVQLGAGVDYGTNSGMLNLQLGVPIPVNNKNQGNIAAARAEVCRAHLEAQRIENGIKSRLAAVSQEYDTAAAALNQYASDILPSAVAAMELAEQAYQAGETDFVQLLIARKTFFDSNLQYVNAQSQLAVAQAKIDGYVLTGALDAVRDESGDDSLRGLTFSQQ